MKSGGLIIITLKSFEGSQLGWINSRSAFVRSLTSDTKAEEPQPPATEEKDSGDAEQEDEDQRGGKRRRKYTPEEEAAIYKAALPYSITGLSGPVPTWWSSEARSSLPVSSIIDSELSRTTRLLHLMANSRFERTVILKID